MPNTDGRYVAKQGFPDGTMFLGVSAFKDIAGLATGPTYPAAGTLELTVPSTDASNFVIDLIELLQRSGVYATPAYDQEQFGTGVQAAPTLVQPGPSSVTGTGGPDQIFNAQPPILKANLMTVSGSYVSGPQVKGISLNSIDVIYQVNTVIATLAQIGVYQTTFKNAIAPSVNTLLTLAANGLPTAIATQPTVTNVPLTAPAYLVGGDTQYLVNLKLTAGSGGTITVFGIVPRFSYNFA